MLVQGNDNLTVAVAFEPVFSRKLLTIFLVIIELAVDHGMDIILGVMEGLVAIWAKVDDGESDVAKCCTLSVCDSEETVIDCHTNTTILADPFSSSIRTTILHQFQAGFNLFFKTRPFLPATCHAAIFIIIQASSESAHDASWFSSTHRNKGEASTTASLSSLIPGIFLARRGFPTTNVEPDENSDVRERHRQWWEEVWKKRIQAGRVEGSVA
jgi:hypothetical protein